MSQITSWENQRYKRIEGYAKQISAIFDKAAAEAASIGQLFDKNDLFSKPFAFDDYPITKDRIDKLITQMQKDIQGTVVNGVTAEWENSNFRNDQLAQQVLGINAEQMKTGTFKRYFNNNQAALKAFIERKDYGLKLSDRIWNYTNKFKKEIELGLDLGIRSGLGASEMAKELKQYLKYPDKLFRRVRDEHGQLQLSMAAKAFHPGRGVYRSSYKNAMRVARTETNMAYRTADHMRHQQWDFIVGIEIRLTNNPGHVTDICDDLKGKYPKEFKFVGWHPHCMCHQVTIMKTKAEIDADVQKLMNGEKTDGTSQNAVTDLPKNFREWAEANKGRIAGAKQLPYFIRDNFAGTDVSKWKIDTRAALKPTPIKPTPMEIAASRHAARTPEQQAAIQELWDVRKARQTAATVYKPTPLDIAAKRHANRDAKEIQKAWDKRQWDRDILKIHQPNAANIKFVVRKYELMGRKVTEQEAAASIVKSNEAKAELQKYINEARKITKDKYNRGTITKINNRINDAKDFATSPFAVETTFKLKASELKELIAEAEKRTRVGKVADIRHAKRNEKAIQAAWDKRKAELAAERAKKPVTIPDALKEGGEYLKGTNIKVNSDIFTHIDERKPLKLKISTSENDGSQFNPATKEVRLQLASRVKKSAWQRESVIYHEYGHAIDHQKNLRNSLEMERFMKKWKKELLKDVEVKKGRLIKDSTLDKYVWKTVKVPRAKAIMDRGIDFYRKVKRMDSKTLAARGITKDDVLEQLSSLADTLKALTLKYGDGHTTAYFKKRGMSEAELIAHAFENKFIGNLLFKKLEPDLYQDMIDWINRAL